MSKLTTTIDCILEEEGNERLSISENSISIKEGRDVIVVCRDDYRSLIGVAESHITDGDGAIITVWSDEDHWYGCSIVGQRKTLIAELSQVDGEIAAHIVKLLEELA